MGACSSAKKTHKHLEAYLSPRRVSEQTEPSQRQCPVSHRMFLHSYSYSVGQSYQLMEVLGSGTFSEVRKAYHLPTGQYRAIKQIKKQGITDYTEYLREIGILRSLDHPNILRAYEFIEDKKYYYIVTELCSGNIFDYVHQNTDHSEEAVAQLMRQVFIGLAFCHSKGLAHRDLKPENILVMQTELGPIVKIADFGSSTWAMSGVKGLVGTPYYIAPEVVEGSYSYTCDLWSCGIMLFILLTGRAPYNGKNPDAILDQVKRRPFQLQGKDVQNLSGPAIRLLMSLLRVNPDERLSANQAANHPWICRKNKPLQLQGVTQRFAKLTGMGRLQRAARSFIANQLSSHADAQKLGMEFEAFDTNGDGQISLEEFKTFLKANSKLKYTDEELTAMMAQLDSDCSGYIDYTEFLEACLDEALFTNRKMLEYAFEQFDLNGDGQISIDELQQILNTPRESMFLQKIMEEGDKDCSGGIDLNEFIALMGNVKTQKF